MSSESLIVQASAVTALSHNFLSVKKADRRYRLASRTRSPRPLSSPAAVAEKRKIFLGQLPQLQNKRSERLALAAIEHELHDNFHRLLPAVCAHFSPQPG